MSAWYYAGILGSYDITPFKSLSEMNTPIPSAVSLTSTLLCELNGQAGADDVTQLAKTLNLHLSSIRLYYSVCRAIMPLSKKLGVDD